MDDHLHKDPLEQFFKKAFEDEQNLPVDDDWDIPSDQVWDNIDSRLPAVKPGAVVRTMPGKWWYWAAAAVVVVALMTYHLINSNQQFKEMADQVESNTKLIDELKQQTQDLKSNLPPKNTVDSQLQTQDLVPDLTLERRDKVAVTPPSAPKVANTGSIDEADISSSAAANSTQVSDREQESADQPITQAPNTKATDVNDTSPTKPAEQLIINEEEPSNIVDQQVIEQKETHSEKAIASSTSGTTKETLENREKMTDFDLLPTQNIYANSSVERLPASMQKAPIVPVHRLNPSRGWYAGAYIAPGQTYRQISAGNTVSRVRRRMLNDQELGGTSLKLGFELGYQWSPNWSVETGFIYERNKIQSRHRHQLRYNRNGERPTPNGELENDYQAILQTSYGEVQTDLSVTRASTTMIEQFSFINMDLDTEQQLEFFKIPLLVRYQKGRGPFRWTIKTGFAASFLLRDQVSFLATRSLRSGIRGRHLQGRRSRSLSQLNKTTIDYILGVGFAYQLAPHWQLNLEPTVSRSINPIYNEKDIRTYPMSFGVQIGSRYFF
ncbi:MAG: outer membrane beta-barrel protein [Bacteroidota bacterium]